MIGRGFAVLAVLVGAAMALEARFGGFGAETADPVALVAALLVLFVIIVTILPARPGDYAQVTLRGGSWSVLIALGLVAYAHGNLAQEANGRPHRVPPTTIAVASVSGEVELRRGDDGHFRARADIGEAEIGLMLDTGASIVLLRHEDARRIGLDVDRLMFSTPVTTANGRAMVASVTLDAIRIGDLMVKNVRAAVAQPGNLHTSLLGMSFIGELREASIQRDRVILRN